MKKKINNRTNKNKTEFQERKKTLLKSFFPSLGQIRLISFYVSEDHLNKRTQRNDSTTVRWRRLLAKVFFFRKFVFFISKKSQFQGSKKLSLGLQNIHEYKKLFIRSFFRFSYGFIRQFIIIMTSSNDPPTFSSVNLFQSSFKIQSLDPATFCIF
jgi:hypothetical protein